MRAPVLRIVSLALVLACVRIDETFLPPDQKEPTSTSALMPAPVSGGTLALTSDGRIWVASDPNADSVWIAEVVGAGATAVPVPFEVGAQPGRVMIENDQRAHVVLRGGGAVATIDLAMKQLEGRVSVCPEPRGIAWDALDGKVRVACADGQLVSFAPQSPASMERVQLDDDLRDIVVTADGLWVSRFRSAELLHVRSGAIVLRVSLPDITVFGPQAQTTYAPGVAWRLIALESGELAVVHQGARIDPAIDLGSMATGSFDAGTSSSGSSGSPYGSTTTSSSGETCAEAVRSFVTTVDPTSGATSTTALRGALPVDIASGPTAGDLVVASAGDPKAEIVFANTTPTTTVVCESSEEEFPTDSELSAVAVASAPTASALVVQEETPDGRLLQLTATVGGTAIRVPLFTPRAFDPGRALFHLATRGNSMACASCHPEATEDGRVWNFLPIGARRTQALRGGILARAPYHWDGDLPTFESLMVEVFGRRMGATFLTALEATQVATWLDSVPALKTGAADEGALRGESLFTSGETGCATCHSGALLTSGARVDVGTGGMFKVPSLIGLGRRAPYMHDGCAATLEERFSGSATCGGGEFHGSTAHLTADQLSDLVAYLKTL